MITEFIGWTAATVLLATIGRQVYSQWRSRSSQGVSKWLFIGQITASVGFVVYSWLLGNWVFVVTNALMLCTASWDNGFIPVPGNAIEARGFVDKTKLADGRVEKGFLRLPV
jgi:MtN3 and saliva related transmembrane protein